MQLPIALTRFAGKVKLGAIEHSPELLIIAGTVGLVATVVESCKSTLKFQEALDLHKERMKKLDQIEIDKTVGRATPEQEAIDISQSRMSVRIETAKAAIKVYYKPAVLGILTAAAYMGAAGIFKKRYLTMAGAFVQLFDEKTELEKELSSLRAENKTIDAHVDEETGEVVEDTVTPADEKNIFVRIFDETNPNYEKDRLADQRYLTQMQRFANDRLDRQGHLFLNDVLDMLGYEKTQTGQMFGWIRDEYHNSVSPIDFGIDNIRTNPMKVFSNGSKLPIVLTFNVDPKPIIGRVGLPVS